MTYKSYSDQSGLCHWGIDSQKQGGAVNPALSKTSTMIFDSCEAYEDVVQSKDKKSYVKAYGRYGTETTEALKSIIANMDNAQHVFLSQGGLSALSHAYFSLLQQGDHVLLSDGTYAPFKNSIMTLFAKYGVEYSFYEPTSLEDLSSKITPKTKIIHIESPSSNTFEIQDIDAIVAIAKEHNIWTIADNTWASSLYMKPLDLGVDLVIQAATKSLNGNSDVLMGVSSTNNEEIADKLIVGERMIGTRTTPDDAYAVMRGIRSLYPRMKLMQENGLVVANFLESQDKVLHVHHAALPSHPQHHLWKKYYRGSMSVFSISFKENYSKENIYKFVNSCKAFGIGLSWAGFESLMFPFKLSETRTTYCKKTYPNDYVVRIYCGLEDTDYLIESLGVGLKTL